MLIESVSLVVWEAVQRDLSEAVFFFKKNVLPSTGIVKGLCDG